MTAPETPSASAPRDHAGTPAQPGGASASGWPGGGPIHGIGTDICEVGRIAAALERHGERFAQRVLGPHEIEVFRARRAKFEARGVAYLATRFSAKEAFSKAIGLGMRMPMTWRDCEVVKAASGKPEIRLHGALRDWFEARGLAAHVSVSDESRYACAFVVVEKTAECLTPRP